MCGVWVVMKITSMQVRSVGIVANVLGLYAVVRQSYAVGKLRKALVSSSSIR